MLRVEGERGSGPRPRPAAVHPGVEGRHAGLARPVAARHRHDLDPDDVQFHAVSRVHRFEAREPAPLAMDAIRRGCWREEAVTIRYTNAAERATERRIYPLAVVYHERSLTVLAWCCLRGDFRMFRASRIAEVRPSDESFRPRRATLLRDYLARIAARGRAAKAQGSVDRPP